MKNKHWITPTVSHASGLRSTLLGHIHTGIGRMTPTNSGNNTPLGKDVSIKFQQVIRDLLVLKERDPNDSNSTLFGTENDTVIPDSQTGNDVSPVDAAPADLVSLRTLQGLRPRPGRVPALPLEITIHKIIPGIVTVPYCKNVILLVNFSMMVKFSQ